MVLEEFGKLVKLEITQMNTGETIHVMFNPESYSETFSNVYHKVEDVNAGMEEYVYNKTLPQDLKLKMIIDGTGVSEYSSSFFPENKSLEKSVYERVNEFLKLTWYPEAGNVKPLRIKWDKFVYHCFLKEVVINYTLFDRDGLPLRAELDTGFVSNPEENMREYKERFGLKSNRQPTQKTDSNQSTLEKNQSKKEVGDGSLPGGQNEKPSNGIVISVS